MNDFHLRYLLRLPLFPGHLIRESKLQGNIFTFLTSVFRMPDISALSVGTITHHHVLPWLLKSFDVLLPFGLHLQRFFVVVVFFFMILCLQYGVISPIHQEESAISIHVYPTFCFSHCLKSVLCLTSMVFICNLSRKN